jgi:excisionase family DNA binding protein
MQERYIMKEQLLTVKEVADLLNCDEQTVYRNKDAIGYTKIFGGRLRFERSKVMEYLTKQTVEPVTN